MSWYRGDIPQAITESRSQSKVFVVYISGANDASKQMDKLWEDEKVIEICSSNCVCLKLDEQSEGCKQFSAIYPVLCVPSAYFVGNNGNLIEAMTVQENTDEFISKIEKVVESFRKNVPQEKQPTSNVAGTSHGSESTADDALGEGSSQDSEVQQPRSEEEIKKKVDDMREKIKEKRLESAEKEKELEKQRELERRELGKNMQKLKDAQKEAKLKREIAERNREKLEEKVARERVRKQIEQDKRDRAERFKQEKLEREEAELSRRKETERLAADSEKEKAKQRSLQARLQFRMPDGSTFNQTFQSSDVLQSVYAYVVSQNHELFKTMDSFNLAVSFPRRVFAEEDHAQTLGELGLSPSASIVVLPRTQAPSQRSSDNSLISQIFSLVMFIIMIPVSFLQYLWSIIAGPPHTESQGGARSPERPGYMDDNSGARTRNVPNSMDVRRRGNTARLSDMRRDDQDDDATWNGNSTQQM